MQYGFMLLPPYPVWRIISSQCSGYVYCTVLGVGNGVPRVRHSKHRLHGCFREKLSNEQTTIVTADEYLSKSHSLPTDNWRLMAFSPLNQIDSEYINTTFVTIIGPQRYYGRSANRSAGGGALDAVSIRYSRRVPAFPLHNTSDFKQP